MTDPSFTPERDRELMIVYPDAAHARVAASALLEAGVPEHDIHVDREPDTVVALRSEMHDELTNAWVVPNAGIVYPSGSARGLMVIGVTGTVLAVLAAFALALIDFGSTYAVRWLVWAVIGIGFSWSVAFVAGAAAGAPRPSEAPAVARGTLLRVEHDSPELRRLLTDLEPLRMDEVTHEGDPIGSVSLEHPETPSQVAEPPKTKVKDTVRDVSETAKDMAANTRGDDYRPER